MNAGSNELRARGSEIPEGRDDSAARSLLAGAERLRSQTLIGTSGFSYADWVGPFYPAGTKSQEMLAYYAARFPVVELDFTYYAMPRAQTIEAMLHKAGPQLLFSVKANRTMTHEIEQLHEACSTFVDGLQPMIQAGRLAAVLLQFPWAFQPSETNWSVLEEVVAELTQLPLVVEFRHHGWIQEATFKWLREHAVGFCCVDEPRLPGLLPPVARLTSSIGYIRFHGRNKAKWWQHEKAYERYDYLYTAEELAEWIPTILAMEKSASLVLVHMNNHYLGQAVRNAEMLIELLAKARTKEARHD